MPGDISEKMTGDMAGDMAGDIAGDINVLWL